MTFDLDPDSFQLYEQSWESYEELYESFEWDLPDEFNMARYVCDLWADGSGRVAVRAETHTGETDVLTYDQLKKTTDCLAGYLSDIGVGRGDMVAINAPQKPETVVAHIAAWKLGAVSIPLSELFGPDALEYRLAETDTTVCFVDQVNIEAVREAAGRVDSLETLITINVDSPQRGEIDIRNATETGNAVSSMAATTPEDDAVIIYTSGTTGDPKGVLHGHRLLLGQQPLFATTYTDLELSDTDVFWTPAPWAWVGMFAMVFPPLYHGREVVAYQREAFEPEAAFDLIDRYDITVISLPPTSMRMMMQSENPGERYDLSSVRLVPTGGEEVTEPLEDWVNDVFDGARLHTAFGQTEANGILGECSAVMKTKRGSLGQPIPGHDVTVVDKATAEPLEEPGEIGEIAVRYDDDPLLFKTYWNKPAETDGKVENGWLLTEDLGTVDGDGYFTYHSRKDDVIITSGYRVSPGEIEDVLCTHEMIADAGVIGTPDEKRGEVPKAFVELADDATYSPELQEELIVHVRENLGEYEYPRNIEPLPQLPKTVTGKVRRRDLEDRDGEA